MEAANCWRLQIHPWNPRAYVPCRAHRVLTHTARYCGSAICKPPLLSTHPHLLSSVFTHIPKFWCWKLPTCLGNYHVTLSVQLTLQHPWGVWDLWEGDISFEPWTLWKVDSQTVINISSLKQERVGFLMTAFERGSFCIWNCINNRCLNYEAVIYPRLQRRGSENIKPLNQRLCPCQEHTQGSESFLPCNKHSQA